VLDNHNSNLDVSAAKQSGYAIYHHLVVVLNMIPLKTQTEYS